MRKESTPFNFMLFLFMAVVYFAVRSRENTEVP
jgi:hypothetical protein